MVSISFLPCLSADLLDNPTAWIKNVKTKKHFFLDHLNDPNKNCTFNLKENESREKVFTLSFLTPGNAENITVPGETKVEFASQNTEGIYMLLAVLQIEILPIIGTLKWKAYQKAITDLKNNKEFFNFTSDSPILSRKIPHPARLSRSNRESPKTGMEVARRNSLPANVNSSVSKPKK